MNKSLRGKIMIVLGFLLIFIATGIFIFNDYQDINAGKNSDLLLEKYRQEQSLYDTAVYDSTKGNMPIQNFMGYNMVGVITVPSAKVELPVLDEWNYDMLKIAPCRYSGSVEDNNLILLGHNYKEHFYYLKNCVVGDAIMFEDVNGIKYNYKVQEIETLYKTELDKLTQTDYDLTIFTCTASGQSRLVVRCNRI